ncbi:MAG: NupC/NupG family nucleoside CNT transporter [Acidimicrobiales bacterium]|nr:NupC/NupG family nucleoside CNT transporter [Hyphomonadaceae bacterium]RZV43062.1 MAG: NupC/NupG family nucleoside CNT transporter [Acidimicrobiales bacterium]
MGVLDYIGIIGIIVLLGIGYIASSNRKAINPRTIFSALALQFAIALFVFKTKTGEKTLLGLTNGIEHVLNYANSGIGFVFGGLQTSDSIGFTFAVWVLPVIIFVGALMTVLFHLGIMQMVMRAFGFVLRRIIGVNGVEALAASMNIFVGQDSAPFAVRPYLATMPKSTLFLIMVTGMATIAGSILAGLIQMGVTAQYLVVASFMGAPAGILMAKLMMPTDPDEPEFGPDSVKIENTKHRNVIEAAAVGASEGVQLAITIGAMLIAFISLIALLNGIIGGVGGLFGFDNWSFQNFLGWLFRPLMTVVGVPWAEAGLSGSLFGEKLILNEFVAYASMVGLGEGAMSVRAETITTIALCGFANFSSIAIVLGGVGTLAPERRGDLAAFGMKAVLAASLANLLSAAMVGLLI